MTSRPRFSIIIPAHNEEVLLPRGLDALEAGVTASTGEIVVTIDADTIVHPRQLLDMIRGTDSTFVDEYFFDFNT